MVKRAYSGIIQHLAMSTKTYKAEAIRLLTDLFETQNNAAFGGGTTSRVVSGKTWNEVESTLWDEDFEVEDYYYQYGKEAADAMVEGLNGLSDVASLEEVRTSLEETELEAEVYTSALTKRLAASDYYVDYLGEASDFADRNSGFSILSQANWLFKQKVCNIITSAILTAIE